jgi:hypothetical protein
MIQGKSLVPFLCTFIFAGVSQEARGDVARYVACVVGSAVLFGFGMYLGSSWTKDALVKRFAKGRNGLAFPNKWQDLYRYTVL